MVRLDHLERVSFRDGVNKEEALAVDHIVLPHRTVYVPPLPEKATTGGQLPQNRARSEIQGSGVTVGKFC